MRKQVKKEIIRLRKRMRRTQFKLSKAISMIKRVENKWRKPLSFDLDFSDDDFP